MLLPLPLRQGILGRARAGLEAHPKLAICQPAGHLELTTGHHIQSRERANTLFI